MLVLCISCALPKVDSGTETHLPHTDGQVDSTEPTDGHECSIPGHRMYKLIGRLFRIQFTAIGGPPVEYRWPPAEIQNF